MGAIATEGKEWEKAEKHLLAAIEELPDDFMANYCLAHVYLNIDWGELNWAARSKALVFAQKALELDPKDGDAKQMAMAALAAYDKVKPPEKRCRSNQESRSGRGGGSGKNNGPSGFAVGRSARLRQVRRVSRWLGRR